MFCGLFPTCQTKIRCDPSTVRSDPKSGMCCLCFPCKHEPLGDTCVRFWASQRSRDQYSRAKPRDTYAKGLNSTTTTMATNNERLLALATLPEEICIAITDTLNMPSIIYLSQTNRLFHRLSNPVDSSRHVLLEEFLIEAQAYRRWQGCGFACFSCMRVLHRHSFASAHTKGKRGRNGSQQKTRFCIRCGIDKGLYLPGSQVVQDDVIRVVCRQCKKIRGGKFCQRCAFCKDCERQYRDRTVFPTENCEGKWGHTIVGHDSPGEDIPEPLSACPVTALGKAWRMVGYEAKTGELTSLEWFDDADDVGI